MKRLRRLHSAANRTDGVLTEVASRCFLLHPETSTVRISPGEKTRYTKHGEDAGGFSLRGRESECEETDGRMCCDIERAKVVHVVIMCACHDGLKNS